jgi:steroid 5-alpha reductase family enzyme
MTMVRTPRESRRKLVRFGAARHRLVPDGGAWNADASAGQGPSNRMLLPDILRVLAINFSLCVAGFLILWLIATAIRDPTFVDSVWALGMGGLALSTYVQAWGYRPRQQLLAALCCAWALRLGLHLFLRWRAHGPDRRYVRMMEKAKAERGWGYGQASLRLVFLLQAPLMWTVSLPVQLGQMDCTPARIGWLGWTGAAVCAFGIVFEAIADFQVAAFRGDPANAGKVLDSGLWRYSQHPNYFGDIVSWIGLYLIAAETHTGLLALPGPLLLTFILTRWSGGVTYERRLTRTRPGYDDYQRRTSSLIPWPPKPA